MKSIFKKMLISWAGAEVIARGTQWIIPLLLGLTLTTSDFATMMLYLSVLYVSAAIITCGFDKYLIVNGNVNVIPLVIQSVIAIILTIPISIFVLNINTVQSYILLLISIIGMCTLKVNVAYYRVIDDRITYFNYRFFYNLNRLLAYLLSSIYMENILLTVLVVDALFGVLHLIIFKRTSRNRGIYKKQIYTLTNILEKLGFGLSVILTVISSLISLHAARFYLGMISDHEGMLQFVLSFTIGGSISFVFAALAIRGEVLVYKADNYHIAVENASKLVKRMLELAAVTTPIIIGFASVYSMYSTKQIHFINIVSVIVSQALHPLWFYQSYLIYYLKRNMVISLIVSAAAFINISFGILLYGKIGYQSFILANIISIVVMTLLGRLYLVLRSC